MKLTMLWGVLLIGVLFCSDVWSQATAQINGTVKDQSSAILPGVEIIVTQTDTSASRNTISDEAGSFVLPNLPNPFSDMVRRIGQSVGIELNRSRSAL